MFERFVSSILKILIGDGEQMVTDNDRVGRENYFEEEPLKRSKVEVRGKILKVRKK